MNRTLYEFLPTIYIVAGLIVDLLIDNSLGRYSAALLVLAGVIVFNLRIKARSDDDDRT